MSTDEIEAYFEQMATKNLAIGHTPELPRFVRFNIEEVLKGLRAKLDLSHFCLLLEAPEGMLADNGADQVWDQQIISYMVLRQVEANDFAEERATVAQARKICLSILSRLLMEGQFGDMDIVNNPVEYEKVGPVFTNCYGYRYTFTASDPISLRYLSTEWNG